MERTRVDPCGVCELRKTSLDPPQTLSQSPPMSERIALFGGSFNPPGLHHRLLVETLAEQFDRVLVLPCGPRPDKPTTNLIPPVYRAAMTDMTFGDIPRVEVDLSDLEQNVFTRSHTLEARFSDRGEIWHVVGVDLIQGGASGQSEIQRSWENGVQLWQHSRFVVLQRPGHEFKQEDLPPQSRVIEVDVPGASRDIRDMIERGESAESWLTARTHAYIQRYGLYRAPMPASYARGTLAGCSYRLSVDMRNPKAAHWASRFTDTAGPQFVTVIGGDGAMLRSIREGWRERLPHFGVNAGHLGFLMNEADTVLDNEFPPQDVIFRQLPMLYVEVETMEGETLTAYGFNDTWVERDTSQSAWLQVKINDKVRLQKLVSDGALLATAAGSTAYARAMGATPLLADTPAWLLVGSNVMEPIDWKSALLSTDSTVEIESLDPERRPVRAFIDGHDQKLVRRLKARISRAAAVELVFDTSHDMAEKLAALQFRQTGLTPVKRTPAS
jgi:NAD+ kinase